MQLRNRFRASAAISFATLLLLATVLGLSWRASNRASAAQELTRLLRRQILERGIVRDEYFVYREERARAQWYAKSARMRELLKSAVSAFDAAHERETIGEMMAIVEQSDSLFGQVVGLPNEQGTKENEKPLSIALRERVTNRLLLLSYDLYSRVNGLAEAASRRARSTEKTTLLAMMGLVGTALAITIVNSTMTSRLLERRITRLQTGAERIAAGDFAHRIGFVGDDELAALGRSFDEMVEKLRSITVSRDALEAEVGERLKAQKALSSTEERFRIAAETSNDVIYEWDLKERVDWFGDIDGLLGWSRHEFPRTLAGWAEFLHPEDRSAVMASIQAHLEGRAPYIVEYRMFRKDGGVRWWSARGTVARLPDGAPSRWVGTITDITERKQAEEALRESESRFRQLAESLPQLVWTCRPDGPCDYLNRQWIDFTGVPEAQQFGFGWLEQLHPDDRAPTVAAWEAAVASGANFRVEFRIRRHDGEYRWFDTQAVRLLDAEGHTAKWYGSNTDITERKRAEESIQKLLRAVEQAENVIFMTEPAGVITYVNPAFEKTYGYSKEEAVGKTPRILKSGLYSQAFYERFWQRLLTGEPVRQEFVNKKRDGELVTVDQSVNSVLDAAGKRVGFIAVQNDITERKRAEEAIRRLNAELEQRVVERTAQLETANKELEAFSYSVSHDLRAPLRAMDGFSRILLEDYDKKLDAEGKRLLGIVRTNTVQMGNLIDDLLSFSRLGRQEMVRTDVDMEALANAAFVELGPAGDGVAFAVGPLPRASADPSLMRQVFLNLISNAVKFTGPKAVRSVEVGARAEAGRVVYWVKDNGVGFDMTYADKLFGVFQRLHSAAEFEGTGVGLALVQRIVHRHGGEVWAEGKIGEGAIFSFSLPHAGGL